MSLKKLIRSASFDCGFLTNAIISIRGTRPILGYNKGWTSCVANNQILCEIKLEMYE
jgi:hypothetical protein